MLLVKFGVSEVMAVVYSYFVFPSIIVLVVFVFVNFCPRRQQTPTSEQESVI